MSPGVRRDWGIAEDLGLGTWFKMSIFAYQDIVLKLVDCYGAIFTVIDSTGGCHGGNL